MRWVLLQVDGKKQKEEEENWAGGGKGIKYQIQTDRTLAYRWALTMHLMLQGAAVQGFS